MVIKLGHAAPRRASLSQIDNNQTLSARERHQGFGKTLNLNCIEKT